MSQNIYDDPHFFAGYATLDRSVKGLDGAPEWPSIQAMLPELAGKRILDLGCGYGWFCRYARDNHAAHVLGVDLSEKMLAQAQSMTSGDGIDYRREDLETLALPPASYDLIYSSLALHYLRDIDRLFATVYQALTPGGMLVFSAEHPVYTAPLTQGWIIDKTQQKSWPVNHYQQEGERLSNWFAEGVKKQHRKLATWINALITAGFEIVHLNEWGPTDEQIAANPALDEEKERPMVFLISVRKPK
ncbi:SAM-dependent methyltransferase [Citrobacter amalonaticus]|uniref:SAM-dependent methyltransferase n=1 Tax=Citrobacter amalonaticus TaxID=35703 RepID=A0A2S4S314_CITAM|nr:class I SAM-dependent methyltransferase [Citrobacter amalonaticus]POT59664.1 SAM-dependent methyltransferase [Citrobacter amalonaticus]POT77794.1 SAM-dependent methyltransferase [Citrobacter amalonaticus]POU68246.1 SAM-dependent methyltransferase [Citrobacter amalonaticus]POV07849.1 SAM-dependent methyltransferase [Citrobacter amalonaticus]